MGAVYLARHIQMGEPRALKFLSPELSRDEAFTGRFLREARTLRQIRSRNVVDCGDLEAAEDDSLFFSMEFVDGPDLRAFLNASHPGQATAPWVPHVPLLEPGIPRFSTSRFATGHDFTGAPIDRSSSMGWGFNRAETAQDMDGALAPEGALKGTGFSPYIESPHETGALAPAGSLPVELALHIARGITEGLGVAHSKGMVHRDIKPENILLARDGDAWLPKIADFGIVAIKESSTVYTRTGGTLLTMAYAAPEQWRGLPAAELDGRTDFYALGGLLYEMLTGQTPFRAENYEGWARQHQTTPAQPPSALRPDLAHWRGLDALVLRLLAKDRNDRPKDVAELLGLLDAVRCLPSNAHRETVAEHLRSQAAEMFRGKKFRRIPRGVWILSVSVMALAIVIAGLAFGLPSSTISKQADKLDAAQHFDLGGILRNLACTRGDGEACLALGDMYAYGRGIIRDYARGAALLSAACDAGIAEGCGNLAYQFEDGQGVGRDRARAAALFSREAAILSKACNAGEGASCYNLGWNYEIGDRVAKDPVRAADSFSKGCNAGNAKSCAVLSTMYGRGDGVRQSNFESVALNSKACNLGDEDGCITAAIAYEYGKVIELNTVRARQLWEKACNMGSEWGCSEAAKLQ